MKDDYALQHSVTMEFPLALKYQCRSINRMRYASGVSELAREAGWEIPRRGVDLSQRHPQLLIGEQL